MGWWFYVGWMDSFVVRRYLKKIKTLYIDAFGYILPSYQISTPARNALRNPSSTPPRIFLSSADASTTFARSDSACFDGSDRSSSRTRFALLSSLAFAAPCGCDGGGVV